MTIFAVLLPSDQPALTAEITRVYPNDHFKLNETQWLISSNKTVTEVSHSLGVSSNDPQFTAKGLAVIFATSSYFGRAPTTVWDWIKVKLEGQAGG
jgi:hypothetical protein